MQTDNLIKTNNNTLTKWLYYLLLSVAFHAFPVLKIAGKVKIVEILTIFISFSFRPRISFRSTFSILLFLLFVVSPLLSLCYQYLLLPYPQHIFNYYGSEANVLKFNYYVWPILQNIFMIVAFLTLYLLYFENGIYSNIQFIIRKVISLATFISIYSLVTNLISFDPLRLLPDFFHGFGNYEGQFRTRGFFQEPSNYVVYQSWIVLFVYYSRGMYSTKKWIILLSINILSLILTKSVVSIGCLGCLLFSPFLFKTSLSKRISNAMLIMIVLLLSWFGYMSTGYLDKAFNKIEKYLDSDNTTTLSSAGFRNYTSNIGFNIYDMHPIFGVGVGCSIYYMHLFEDRMGIIAFGETLQPGHRPQNLLSCVLAEQGMLGGLSLLFFFAFLLIRLWKYRNIDNYSKMFFLGTVTNIGGMFSNYIIYSMYLWVFIILGIGYVRFKIGQNI